MTRHLFWNIYPQLEKRLTSVFYHFVSNKVSDFVKNLYEPKNISKFQRDISFFENNFNFVSEEQVEQYILGKSDLPSFPLFLSFDDGHQECHQIIAPILESKKIPATFYLTTSSIDNSRLFFAHKKSYLLSYFNIQNFDDQEDLSLVISRLKKSHPFKDREFIEELGKEFKVNWDNLLKSQRPYLTKEQINDLIDMGFSIGAHGVEHIKHFFLNKTQQRNQIELSTRIISELSGVNKVSFSFPNSHRGVSILDLNEWSEKIDTLSFYVSTNGYSKVSPCLLGRINMEKKIDGLPSEISPEDLLYDFYTRAVDEIGFNASVC